MTPAAKIQEIITMNASQLTEAIRKAGYKRDRFEESEFLGLTHGGEFCFAVKYFDEDDTLQQTKVFVRYISATGETLVDY